jgi:dTDP-4-amino-4,6-dideoxygalactose transaminase
MAVPFVDLSLIHDPIRAQMLGAIEDVLKRERYILGPDVTAFEGEVAGFLNAEHAVGVSSGTDAVLLALMALGVGPGDEVVTTPFTFVATANTIARLGATPVFADIDPESFNLDPKSVELAITPRTKAVIVVHLFGRSADMDALGEISQRRGVPLVEDCAQAIGAEWAGRRVGTIGALGCFSFFPAKNLGCLGDGGLVTTQDADLDQTIRTLRAHGATASYMYDAIGGNFRLDALQAAVLRVKLPELEGWTQTRQDNALRYQERLRGRGLDQLVSVPEAGPGRHVWNQFVIRVPGGHRSDVFDALRDASIGYAVYYPVALHRQRCFEGLATAPSGCPQADRACEEVLALPIAPGLTPEGQDEVVDALARALGR